MQTVKVPVPAPVDRATIAREQTALFPTRLALARWTSGGGVPDLRRNPLLAQRARWYDQAQHNFQAWLDRGGFTQYDEAPIGREPPAPDGKARSADCCF